MKKAIILGSGRIGRGLLTQLMHVNGYEITHFDASQDLVDLLNAEQGYTINVMGSTEKSVRIENVNAHNINDSQKLAEAWDEAEYIFTAVGGNNLKAVAHLLAKAYKKRQVISKSNVIICENWLNPAQEFSEYLEDELGDIYADFSNKVGISEAVVLTTGSGSPDGNGSAVDTWVQDFLYLPVNEKRLIKPYQKLEYIDYEDEFDNLLIQKIYTNNTSVASIAYLGNLLELETIGESANDPRIEPILDGIYEEINSALVQGLGISFEKQLAFSKRAKQKYQDRNIVDQTIRVGRDPIRKLKINDRLIGPSKMCMSIGLTPENIAFATAAALRFRGDKEGVEVNDYCMGNGISKTLQKYSGLSEGDDLIKLIIEADKRLEEWLV